MHCALVATLLCLGILCAVVQVQACSCLAMSVFQATRRAPAVIRATVTHGTTPQPDGSNKASVQITTIYKGCLADRKRNGFRVTTPEIGAACGLPLEEGTEWLLIGSVDDAGSFDVNICGGSRLWADLEGKEVAYLDTIVNPCTGDCANAAVSSCFIDPCVVAKCQEATNSGAACESNYCGGCHAHWWLNDDLLCY